MNISSNMQFAKAWSLGAAGTTYSAAVSVPSAAPAGLDPQDLFTPSQTEDLGIYKPVFRVADSGSKVTTVDVAAAKPSTEKELRKFYATEAPHHDLIAKAKYADAGRAYREDAAKLQDTDPQRAVLEARANQLDYAAKLAKGGQKVSFPPTLEQVKTHFRGLRKADAETVSKEYTEYVNTYYKHIQTKKNPTADVVYDSDASSKVRDESNPVATATPEDFADVTDQRTLNHQNRRLIDCEGYAWLGEQLLGEAGFHQGKDGSHMLMLGQEVDGSQRSHLMLFLKRDNGEALHVSNNQAFGSAREAMRDAVEALKLPSGKETEVYRGKNEREALAHANSANQNYRVKRKDSW